MPKRGSESQIGIAEETTWGTAVTVTKFYEFRSESIEHDIANIESSGIRAGRFNTARTATYARHKRGAGGSIEMELMNKGFGIWFKHMLGTNATTGSAGVFTHTASIGSLTGDSLTIQKSLQDIPLTYKGCKISEWEMTCGVNELATLSVTIDAREEDSAIALATATYPTGLVPFSFLNGTLTVAGSEFLVNSISLNGNNNLANERFKVRTDGKKDEQLDQGREYGGTMETDFESLTAYNRFVNGTEAALTFVLEGGTISGADKFTITVSAPVIRTDGSTPTVGSPDLIPLSQPFRILDDSLTIAYKTSDATI